MSARLVDLAYPIHEGMTTFPVHWHPLPEVTLLGRHGIEGRETRRIVLGTHTGTHIDAPSHFVPGADGVDSIPLDVLVGPCTLLDFTDLPERTGIGARLLEERIGDGPAERIVLRFDWSHRWGSLAFYENHPYLTPDAAEWLISSGCRLLGMDSSMPDDSRNGKGSERDSPIHKILLGARIVLLEYLCNLDKIRATKFTLITAPLNILGADGAPARCIAVVED